MCAPIHTHLIHLMLPENSFSTEKKLNKIYFLIQIKKYSNVADPLVRAITVGKYQVQNRSITL